MPRRALIVFAFTIMGFLAGFAYFLAVDLLRRNPDVARPLARLEDVQLADFEQLKAEFGVDWVLVSYPQPAGLACPWHNAALAACRIP